MPAERSRTRIEVVTTPRARHSEIDGLSGGRLRVRVCAPPVDGKANRELLRLLSGRLSVPRSSVRIVRGESSRTKLIEVEGLKLQEALERLEAPGP